MLVISVALWLLCEEGPLLETFVITRKKSWPTGCDLLILHNIVSAKAIRVRLNIDKPPDYLGVEPKDECLLLYLSKMVQNAEVSEDIKWSVLLEGTNSI